MGIIESLSILQLVLIAFIPLLIILFSINILIHRSVKRSCGEIVNSSGYSAGEILSIIGKNTSKRINLDEVSNREINSPIIINVITSLQKAIQNYNSRFQNSLSVIVILTSIAGYVLILSAFIMERSDLIIYGFASFYLGVAVLVIKVLSLFSKGDEIMNLLKKFNITDQTDLKYYQNYFYTESLLEGKNLFIILYYLVIFLNPIPAIKAVRNQNGD